MILVYGETHLPEQQPASALLAASEADQGWQLGWLSEVGIYLQVPDAISWSWFRLYRGRDSQVLVEENESRSSTHLREKCHQKVDFARVGSAGTLPDTQF